MPGGGARSSMLGRIVALLALAGALATAALRIAGGPWRDALGPTLLLLALRLALMIAGVLRGRGQAAQRPVGMEPDPPAVLPWPRLLLPAILLVEGAGVYAGGDGSAWNAARIATAISLELAVIAIAIVQLRRPARGALPEDRLARAVSQLVPPPMARAIAIELVLLASSLRFLAGGWRRPLAPGLTYARTAVLGSFLAILPLLALGDVILLELVIVRGAALWLRLLLHGLALYSVLWLVGLWATFRARPHRVDGGVASLHLGVLRRVDVPLASIARVAELPAFADDWKRRAYLRGAIRACAAGSHALELTLREPVAALGLFGPGRPRARVIVGVDDPDAFRAAVSVTVAA